MKKQPIHLIFRIPVLLIPLILALSGCHEEPGPDIRDTLLGYYDYQVKIYDQINGDLVYLGDQPGFYDITGVMHIEKNPHYSDMIDFYEDDELLFQGEHIRDAGNAIVFDVPLQEGWVGPLPVQVSGYDYWEVDGSMYHGAYLTQDQQVEIGFSAYIMDVDSGLIMVLTADRN